MKKTNKSKKQYSDLSISILIGLDDIAHNRLYNLDLKTGKSTPVDNYGKRNRKAKCCCRLLKSLGVKNHG